MATRNKLNKAPCRESQSHSTTEAQEPFPSYEVIYRQCFDFVFYTILKIVRNRCIASELTQDVFLKYLNYPEHLDRRLIRPWLWRVAYRQAIDHVRLRKNKPCAGEERLDVVPATSPDLDDQVDLSENIGLLHQLLSKLPLSQREVIDRHFFKQLSLKEAAADLGITVGAYKCLKQRALAALRRAFKERDAGKRQALP